MVEFTWLFLTFIFASLAVAASGPVVVGYHLSWKNSEYNATDFSKYTHINMAFGIPVSDGSITYEGKDNLQTNVANIHSKGAKVLLSVGGWTGSNLISTILKDKTANAAFRDAITNWIKEYELDGVDIDWEYPGRKGNECNVVDAANDTPNFLIFLKDLRAAFDTAFGAGKKLITLAVRVEPFDVDGAPSKDVSEFAKYVDFANMMQYDINGGWNKETGPNAPMNFENGKGLQASFVSAIDAWTGAGWPANQLTAGIGFYGRSTIASVDMTKDPTNQYQPQQSVVPLGDSEDASWYDACAGSAANSGIWKWRNLRGGSVLSDPKTAVAPWVRQWDPVSQTPWLFNPSTKQFISYDDQESIKLKVDYAASKGLLGSMIWGVEMDYKEELLSVVKSWSVSAASNTASEKAAADGVGDGAGTSGSDAVATGAATDSAAADDDDDDDDVKCDDDNTAANATTAANTGNTAEGDYNDDEFNDQCDDTPIDSGNNNSANTGGDTDGVTTDSSSPSTDQTNSSASGGSASAGGACATNGQMDCADSSGGSSTYFVCDQGKWLQASCGTGTVCWKESDVMYCGWPKA